MERRFRYLLGVLTGLRDGEVSGLRFNSITDEDGSGPTIHVDEALALVSIGKGYGFQAPKTEDSVRLVPVHGLLGEALGWWRSTGWTIWVGSEPSLRSILLGHVPQGVSERHYTAATLRRLRAAIDRLSLPLCPADLSSSLVQSLVQKGSACTKPARKNARKPGD